MSYITSLSSVIKLLCQMHRSQSSPFYTLPLDLVVHISNYVAENNLTLLKIKHENHKLQISREVIRSNDLLMCKILIKKNQMYAHPIDIAAEFQRKDLITWFYFNDWPSCTDDATMYAIRNNDLQMITLLHDYHLLSYDGIIINHIIRNCNSKKYRSSPHRIDALRLYYSLSESLGVNLDINYESVTFTTIFSGDVELLEFIYEKYTTHDKKPDIFTAVKENHVNICQLLIEKHGIKLTFADMKHIIGITESWTYLAFSYVLDVYISSCDGPVDNILQEFITISRASHKPRMTELLVKKKRNII